MRIAAFTSLNTAYIPNGRIIAKSLKEYHPEWDFFLLFNDHTPPEISWALEPFDKIVFSDWLRLERPWYKWVYQYNVIEHCTATKGRMTQYLFDVEGYDAVVYLDPDTVVFSRMCELEELLVKKNIGTILTPHLTDREYDEYSIWSHEMAALKHGTFNLGFFAVINNQYGRAFLDWWADRLVDYSHIDFERGLFTDQKWANIAPYIFEGVHVLCHKSYNTATWNMTGRKVWCNKGKWMVNDQPLRFYHFSGFGHDFHWADQELKLLGGIDNPLYELWNLYKAKYFDNRLSFEGKNWIWSYRTNQIYINNNERKITGISLLNPFEK